MKRDLSFTEALLKSKFTHMHPRDVRHYLPELGRVIKPGGGAACRPPSSSPRSGNA